MVVGQHRKRGDARIVPGDCVRCGKCAPVRLHARPHDWMKDDGVLMEIAAFLSPNHHSLVCYDCWYGLVHFIDQYPRDRIRPEDAAVVWLTCQARAAQRQGSTIEAAYWPAISDREAATFLIGDPIQARVLKRAEDVKIKITRMPLERLRARPEVCRAGAAWKQAAVDFIENRLTDFDRRMLQTEGFVIEAAERTVRRRVLAEVAERYPALADECKRRIGTV